MIIQFSELENKTGYSINFAGNQVAGCYSGSIKSCLEYVQVFIASNDSINIDYKNIRDQQSIIFIENWKKNIENIK